MKIDFTNSKYLVVGSGFFGSVIAERIANILDENVLLIEKRDHIGGNSYSLDDKESGIHYHLYGTHIFHTSNLKVWDYINHFTEFNTYVHQVLTTYKGKVYQMPINLETINSFYGLNLKPYEVDDFLKNEIRKDNIITPRNFEEKAISLVGRPLYEAFIKGYTMKQWQVDPKDLPEFILNRLPFRKNYNENYYFSKWQGIPVDGYAIIFKKMLSNPRIKLFLNTDFFEIKDQIPSNVTVIYSGPLDRYFEYKYGKLEWRTLRFGKETYDYEDYQGTSVMNFAEEDFPYTRIHEPKHLHPEKEFTKKKTLIIKEFSELDKGDNPYYPINTEKNILLFNKYRELAFQTGNLLVGGRLGDYKYYDMHQTIQMSLELFENKILNSK